MMNIFSQVAMKQRILHHFEFLTNDSMRPTQPKSRS